MIYHAKFWGRRVGAIGVWSCHAVDVDAPDEEAARLKLYDTHEHISALTLTPAEERNA